MSSFKISKDTRKGTDVVPIPTGKQEGIVLDSVVFEPLSDGNPKEVLRYKFKDDKDRIFTHTEFEPDYEFIEKKNKDKPRTFSRGPRKGEAMTAQEQFDTEVDEMMVRIKHIATKYMPEDKVKVDSKNWNEFGKKVEKLFDGIDTLAQTMRLLIVYKYNSTYTEFPSYPNFIEPDSIAEDSSTIRITKFHNLKSLEDQAAAAVDAQDAPDPKKVKW